MIPVLEPSGLLPPGEHPAEWDEVESRFGSGDRRAVLLSGLRLACGALSRAGCRRIWLDGSFVTAKPAPGDYDACWDPSGVDPLLLDGALLDWSPAGRLLMKAKFLGDLFPAPPNPLGIRELVEFFQEDRDGSPKGIVILDPRSAP